MSELKKKKYISDDPILLGEWNWKKNNENSVFPQQITTKSNKKVWWLCKNGHEWLEDPYKRSLGKKCPICNHKRVLVGYNDIQTLFPEIAEEWDFEKNIGTDIKTVVVGSHKKVFWKCKKCGYVWEACVADRTKQGHGCPVCARKKIVESRRKTIVQKNGSVDSEVLLSEWDYEKNNPHLPSEYSNGSGKSVWWKCKKCGYSWQAKIQNRANGRGCPCCSNKVVVRGINDLATTHPNLAKEWHPTKNGALSACDVTYGSGKKVWWLCPVGHEYQATVLHRSNGHTNCPICNSGRQTSFAEQAVLFYIKKIYPDAISRFKTPFLNRMELDIYIPSIKTAIEYDGVYWHEDTVEKEKIKYNLCREQGIRLIRLKESRTTGDEYTADECISVKGLEKMTINDPVPLNVIIQHLLNELDPRSNIWTRTEFRCIQSPVIVDVKADENEIREYMVARAENSFAQLRPDLAEEWHPTKNGTLTPNMFPLNSGYKAWWKCKECGHEWQTAIGHRANGTGCAVCYRKKNRGNRIYNARKIYQYDLNGEFIAEWSCISDASRALYISNSNISMCAKHQRNNAGGFRWEYRKADRLDPIVKEKKSKKGLWGKSVLQMDSDGKLIAEYFSLNEAARVTKIDATSISKALHGHMLKAGGFIWRLKN